MVSFVDFGEDFLQFFVDVRCFRQELTKSMKWMSSHEIPTKRRTTNLINDFIVEFFDISLHDVKVIQSLFDVHRLIFVAQQSRPRCRYATKVNVIGAIVQNFSQLISSSKKCQRTIVTN